MTISSLCLNKLLKNTFATPIINNQPVGNYKMQGTRRLSIGEILEKLCFQQYSDENWLPKVFTIIISAKHSWP